MNQKSTVTGKIPPQATDLENAIIGALLVYSDSYEKVSSFLKKECFYLDANQKIFEAIAHLTSRGDSVDLLTVSQELINSKQLENVGGQYHLITLTQKITSSAHVLYHAEIVYQKFLARELIKLGNLVIENGYDDSKNIFESIESTYKELNKINKFTSNNDPVRIGELYDDVVEKGRKIHDGTIEAGIATPIENLTKKSGGWRGGEFIVLAARPGMGKTAFALACAKKSSSIGKPALIFSLEMTKKQLASRVISSASGVNGNKFISHGLDNNSLTIVEQHKQEILDLKIYIDDDHSSSIEKVRMKAMSMYKEYKIGIIIIDYLQLMSGDEKNREQEIANISRGLKKLAIELDIPVIALSQLSRSVETRGGSKRPILSDLRESGAIEQDADMVVFIYRPEYYGLKEWDDYDKVSCRGEAEYIVSKNRNGGLVRNRMKFQEYCTRFLDLDSTEFVEVSEDKDDLPF
jgi:replicative DNA helicase